MSPAIPSANLIPTAPSSAPQFGQGQALVSPPRHDGTCGLGAPNLNATLEFALARIERNGRNFSDKFPASASVDGCYPLVKNVDWTSSFWTGQLWLAYEVSGRACFRTWAEQHSDSYRERAEKRIATDTHDLGFLYSLSAVAQNRLTGDPEARRVALLAADLLFERFLPRAGIIQAWGDLADPEQRGRLIIDCCMNLPLLYWATLQTRDSKYAAAARQHAHQTALQIVRADGSTFHTFYFDVDSGLPRFGRTHQGLSDESCWARGQAWGIYGFSLSHRYTQEAEFLLVAKKLADYYLTRLPADLVCYWDLTFVDGTEERDSSAAAVAACGLLELARQLPARDQDRRRYERAAAGIVESLAKDYTTRAVPGSNGLLQHAVYHKPHNRGVDECNIWGDYFFLEALVRMEAEWWPYW